MIDQIEYRYPAYMAMKNRIIHGDGRIEAPEGTVVVMHCLSNQPMQKARIEFDPEVEDGRFLRASSVRDLDVSGKSIDGQWMLELDDKRTNPTIKSYRVRATNDIGESNLDPVVHPIKILADLAPEVRWIGDNPKSRPLPANGSINVDLRSLDPDYGLREITVIAKHQGRELFQETLFQDEIGDTATITASVFLDAKEREFKPGMVIELTAIAKDNRQRPGTENWEPNISKSSTMEITIVEPSKNPPKAEPKETQAERPEQLKPKLNQPKKDEASNKPKKEPTPQDKDCEGTEEGGSNQSAGSGAGKIRIPRSKSRAKILPRIPKKRKTKISREKLDRVSLRRTVNSRRNNRVIRPRQARRNPILRPSRIPTTPRMVRQNQTTIPKPIPQIRKSRKTSHREVHPVASQILNLPSRNRTAVSPMIRHNLLPPIGMSSRRSRST